MSVEVRQMIIKSNVLQRSKSDEQGCGDGAAETEAGTGKKDCSQECRRLILETLREMKER